MIAQATAPPALGSWRYDTRLRFGWAGLFSLTLHGLFALFVAGIVVHAPGTTPPIRVFLYDTPPPPPALSAAALQEVIPRSEPADRPTQPTHQPVPRIHRRSVPERPRSASTDHIVPPQVDPADGQAGGVRGGVSGGLVGGTVGGTGRTLMPAEEAARQPVAISKVMPEYPAVARLRGIEGQVVLEAILAADGRVEPDIAVVHSVPLLDSAAITALRQWRFEPARDRDGAPLRVTLRVPVRFVLR